MPYVAVRTRCYKFMSFLDGDSLAPVSAKMLPRPDEEGHACGAQNDAKTIYKGVYGSNVEEAEHRKKLKQERGDDGKHEANTLQQVPLGLLFHAYCRNGQIYNDNEPNHID